MKSISRRIYRVTLLICSATIVLFAGLVHFVGEDLEEAILELSFKNEYDYLLTHQTTGELLVTDSALQKVVYVPTGASPPVVMPKGLEQLKIGRVMEFVIDGETFIGLMETHPQGTIYFAKNITLFEERELLFRTVLIVVSLLMLAFTAVVAYVSANRLVRPLRSLASSMSAVPIGANMPPIASPYREIELHQIATNFNQFLDELNQFVERENNLLSLASHELRTPIAVISGALEVIEMRDTLSDKDKHTLERIQTATKQMEMNVEMLLKLARRQADDARAEYFSLNELLNALKEDLSHQHEASRIVIETLATDRQLVLRADRTLVSMMIRNIVHNALQHTDGEVVLALHAHHLDIIDRGSGLSKEQEALLMQSSGETPSGSNGFGLYIVALVSERLQWPIHLLKGDAQRHIIRIDFKSSLIREVSTKV